jgi:hypothetical protein
MTEGLKNISAIASKVSQIKKESRHITMTQDLIFADKWISVHTTYTCNFKPRPSLIHEISQLV